MTQLLTIGVIGKSLKENEKRVAIHPEHINAFHIDYENKSLLKKVMG